MIARFCIRNFKHLTSAELELDTAVVFIGPHNSSKTTVTCPPDFSDGLKLKRMASR